MSSFTDSQANSLISSISRLRAQVSCLSYWIPEYEHLRRLLPNLTIVIDVVGVSERLQAPNDQRAFHALKGIKDNIALETGSEAWIEHVKYIASFASQLDVIGRDIKSKRSIEIPDILDETPALEARKHVSITVDHIKVRDATQQSILTPLVRNWVHRYLISRPGDFAGCAKGQQFEAGAAEQYWRTIIATYNAGMLAASSLPGIQNYTGTEEWERTPGILHDWAGKKY